MRALLPDGTEITLRIASDEVVMLAADLERVKAPVRGYEALRVKLAEAQIKVSTRTLKAWVRRRLLPHRKLGRGVSFYLPEVMEKIGGRR